ncbi:proton-coupled folate transporter-like [Bombyx mandarina]|uniref:Proton-coupled folate transporter-like n=1 Tax=Bombyx mandarina TaxID=7092 RepID=A0A6J2JS78_BOMMA|nr:proton-coupled folate transporter-like [Bombyx mandarina]XP_028031109.1 proton-coupled folate transporter-like [Bombyx mandarina]
MTEIENHHLENGSAVRSMVQNTPRKFHLTMEVPMCLTMLSLSLTGAAVSNILLYRTCLHSLNHPDSVCKVFLALDKTNQTDELEKEVQRYATVVNTVRSIIEAVAPAVLSLFMGVWSDTHGRKPLVVWPLLGMAMTGMMLVVYSTMNDLGPWWLIVTAVPYSLTGGMIILFTGAFCYVSDVTSPENRSLRMTILGASVSAGSVLGGLFSAPLLRAVGNVYLLLIGASLNVFAYAFTNIFLRESLEGAIQGRLGTLLDWSLVKQMARECFKKRPNFGRAQILLLTVANSLTIFILYGSMNLEYLYTREKLRWALKDYTLYSALSTTISFAGGFLGIIVVQKLLKIGDLAFVNVAYLSMIVEYVVKALAVSTWHMYLSSTISLFKGLSSPLLRSLLTKILPITDIAKVFALMSAIEGLCPLLSPLLYNSLYECTISTFPAAFYMLSIGIVCVSCTFIGLVQYFRRNVSTPYERLQDSPTIA